MPQPEKQRWRAEKNEQERDQRNFYELWCYCVLGMAFHNILLHALGRLNMLFKILYTKICVSGPKKTGKNIENKKY